MADEFGPNAGTDGHVETSGDPGVEAGGGELSDPPTQSGQKTITRKEKSWATLAHISYFIFGGIAPLLLIFLHEDIIGTDSEFVRHHAKQAFFWHIAAFVIAIVTCGVGALVMGIWAVLAAMSANRREWYRYPLTGDFADDMEF